jgi:hypothetical protein
MQERSSVLANVYAHRIEEWFGRRFDELAAVAHAPELRTNDPRAHDRVIPAVALRDEEKYPGGVYSLDERGVVFYHSKPRHHEQMNIVGFDASEREYFKDCASQLRPVVSNSFRSANRAEDILVIAVPRSDDAGNFIGILDAVVDVSRAPFGVLAEQVLTDITESGELSGYHVALLLLDQRSLVLGSSDPKLAGKNLGGHPVIVALDANPGATGKESGHGALRPVPGTPFVAVAFWSRHEG